MRIEELKKRNKKFNIIIILLILVAIGTGLYVYKKNNEKMPAEEVTEGIQGYYGMAKYFEMVELGKGKVDRAFYNEVKSDYDDFIEHVSVKDAGFLELARIIYVNEIFDINNRKYLKELEDYYDYGNNLFLDYSVDSLSNPKEYVKENIDSCVDSTLSFQKMFSKLDINKDRYDIKKGLIKQYNVSKDKESKISMIYIFYDMGCLKEINYSDLVEDFASMYCENVEKMKDESYQLDNTDAGTYEFIDVCEEMGIDTSELKKLLKNKTIDINGDGFSLIDNESVSSSVLMSVVYWWDVVNQSSIIEWNDEFWEKLESIYSDYYNLALKKQIQEYSK